MMCAMCAIDHSVRRCVLTPNANRKLLNTRHPSSLRHNKGCRMTKDDITKDDNGSHSSVRHMLDETNRLHPAVSWTRYVVV